MYYEGLVQSLYFTAFVPLLIALFATSLLYNLINDSSYKKLYIKCFLLFSIAGPYFAMMVEPTLQEMIKMNHNTQEFIINQDIVRNGHYIMFLCLFGIAAMLYPKNNKNKSKMN